MKRFAVGAVLALAVSIPAFAQLSLPRPSPNASVGQLGGLTDVSVV